jgi:hypothetical protein
MPTTIGTVDNIKFGDDYGMATILNTSDGLLETFVLWAGDTPSPGPVALYTMLLTVAAARKLTVEIVHEATSAFVLQVAMHGLP